LPNLPVDCAAWRVLPLSMTDLRLKKLAYGPEIIAAIRVLYGADAASLWTTYLKYDVDFNPTVPKRVEFGDGSEVVEGFAGKPHSGFKNALATQAAVNQLIQTAIPGAIRQKL